MFDQVVTPATWENGREWQYDRLFEWTWPRRVDRPDTQDVGGRVFAGLNEWVSTHKYDVDDGQRTRRSWFPLRLFDGLVRCLPLKLDVDSWVGELMYDQHFYSQVEVERFLVYASRIVLDQMVVHLRVAYVNIRGRNSNWRAMLGHDDFCEAAREMLGREFTQLEFDRQLVLSEASDLTEHESRALQDFNDDVKLDALINKLTADEEDEEPPQIVVSHDSSDEGGSSDGSVYGRSVPCSGTPPSLTRSRSHSLSNSTFSSSHLSTPERVQLVYTTGSPDLTETVGHRLSIVDEYPEYP